MSVTVITNNVPRETVDAWELPADVRADFDYVDWAAVDAGEGDAGPFVRYRGEWYDLSDVPSVGIHPAGPEYDWLDAWHGIVSDTFYSGVVFRYPDDRDDVVVGRFYC